MTDFAPWEIPTGGKPLEIRLGYVEETDGTTRIVHNATGWMLLIKRAAGGFEPLALGARLQPGDEVTLPESETEAVDSKVAFRAQLTGVREHDEDRRSRFDPETFEPLPGIESKPERWWWYRRELPHGRVLHLHQASSNARLSVSVAGALGFEGSWCYPNHTDGWRAALGWNGWRDPPDGWIRHLESARRRKDGTPETEYWNADDAPPWARLKAKLSRSPRRTIGRTGSGNV